MINLLVDSRELCAFTCPVVFEYLCAFAVLTALEWIVSKDFEPDRYICVSRCAVKCGRVHPEWWMSNLLGVVVLPWVLFSETVLSSSVLLMLELVVIPWSETVLSSSVRLLVELLETVLSSIVRLLVEFLETVLSSVVRLLSDLYILTTWTLSCCPFIVARWADLVSLNFRIGLDSSQLFSSQSSMDSFTSRRFWGCDFSSQLIVDSL